jgi:DNA-binding LacI/PurR family transcriptional regulator
MRPPVRWHRVPARPEGSGMTARRKRPTMIDVAQHAGVALRTVSRVVNNDPTVGTVFANRVQAAVSALGYTPDERARQLRGGRSGHERAAAFRACMAASGEPVTGLVHPGVVAPARIAAALDAALRGPDPAGALITGNASTTLEVLRHLGSAATGLAIVGFDDFAVADLLRPAITVVAQDSDTIGRTAIDLLRRRTADHTRPVQTVTVGVELIVRGSGERRA